MSEAHAHSSPLPVLLLGATVGSLLSGLPSDRIGRRPTIILSGVLFIVGVVVASYLAHSVAVLIVGRLLIGIAIGVTSGVTPIFIAEVAPKHLRGALVMFYQLRTFPCAIRRKRLALIPPSRHHRGNPAGSRHRLRLHAHQAVAPKCALPRSSSHRDCAIDSDAAIRPVIIMAVIPAALQIVGMLFVPESPRFLLRGGRRADALAVLRRIRGSEAEAQAELAEIELIKEEEGAVTWLDVFGPRYRGPMLAGIGLAVLSALVRGSARASAKRDILSHLFPGRN